MRPNRSFDTDAQVLALFFQLIRLTLTKRRGGTCKSR
jgi:hypothetical protein